MMICFCPEYFRFKFYPTLDLLVGVYLDKVRVSDTSESAETGIFEPTNEQDMFKFTAAFSR